MKISDIMTRDVISVDKDERLQNVLDLMEKHAISKLPVTDDGRVVGVVSDGHIVDELGALRNAGMPASSLYASGAMDRDFEAANPDDGVDGLVDMCLDGRLSILPVLNGREDVVGVVTKADLLRFVDGDAPLRDVMVQELHAVAPQDRVVHARRIMMDQGVERLPVLDGGRLVGLVTETDLAFGFHKFKSQYAAQHQQNQLKRFYVEDVMVRRVITAAPDTTAKEAADAMLNADVGCLPVVENGDKIAGLVTRTDLLRTLT